MNELTFTDANFEQEVIKSSVPVFVDFWAPWCGPCKIAGPIVSRVAKALKGKAIKIGKLNVDENPATAQKYGIMSIPTFLTFRGGKVIDQTIGVPQENALKTKLESYFT